MIWTAALLAVSLLAWPQPAKARLGSGSPVPPGAEGRTPGHDLLARAGALDLLGACLRSGMAVSGAAAAVAASAPTELAGVLRRAADLLALGADPIQAWGRSGAAVDDHSATFLRMARRSAASGAALAQRTDELAAQLRAEAADGATARAERASVMIAAPLGLCFLPAFVCLGIVPVVAGLAGDVLQSGVL
ncbi:MAG: type II secretion system F family protein [Actinomycetota bacterium]|nr:type II secretion system F family protein [Actinomycetota bacterium]